MTTNNALALTRDEWNEITSMPIVHEKFGLPVILSLDFFASRIYGAKFVIEDTMEHDFKHTIYTLVGDLAKDEVIIIERVDGVLQVKQ